MKTRTLTAAVAMTLTMTAMTSLASAQTIIRDSGNGTGNSIHPPGGGQSGLNLNLISDSANGNGRFINLGNMFT